MRFYITCILALLATFAAVAQQNQDPPETDYGQPVKYILGGIEVEGDEYLSRTTIISLSGLRTGDQITIPGDVVSRAITNLWKEKLFSYVGITLERVQNDTAFLKITVQTRPRLSRYRFRGVTKSQANKIRDEINLRTSDILTEQLLSNATYRLTKFFAEKGYPNPTITYTQEPDTLFRHNSVVLTIHIDRGKRLRIEDISFSGNDHFSERRLKRTMGKTKERQRLNPLRGSKMREELYEDDKRALIAFYHSQGYKDATITADSFYIKDNGVRIGITIDEGQKYYYRHIVWSGNTKYTTAFLSNILNIRRGDVYNPEMLGRNLFGGGATGDITTLYMDDGYLFFNAQPVETLVEDDSVDIEIRIFEGPQATINRVIVKGNTRTHDHVILREIRTRPGQKFSRSDIIRSQRELAALGYFDMEKMGVNPIPDPRTGTVDLEYTVEEKPNDQIELSGGYGAGQVIGTLGLTLNNFSTSNLFKPKLWSGYPSGDGQRLSARFQSNGIWFQSYNLSFTEPWLGGRRPNSLSVGGFYSIQRSSTPFASIRDRENRAELKTPGITVGLGKRLRWPDDFFVLQNSLTYQYYTLQNFTLIPQFANGVSNNLHFSHSIIRRSTNDMIYPSEGTMFNLTLAWTPPMATLYTRNMQDLTVQDRFRWIEYHKWKFDVHNYMGLDRRQKFVLATAANFGFLGLYNNRIGLTPFERFLVGGDGLSNFNLAGVELIRQRGYKNYQAVTPALYDVNGNTIEEGAAVYNKFTMELRYPVLNTQATKVYLLGFVEGGNAFLRFRDYNPFELKRAAGVGVRLFLPMFGLLGFDWGYGFDPARNDPSGRPNGGEFHIYIGQTLF